MGFPCKELLSRPLRTWWQECLRMGLRHPSITKLLTPAYETQCFAYARQPYDSYDTTLNQGSWTLPIGPCTTLIWHFMTFHDSCHFCGISVPSLGGRPGTLAPLHADVARQFQSWAGHVRRDRRARCPSCQARPSSASAFTELTNEANGERGERGKRKSLFEPFEKRLGFRKGFRKGSRKGLRQLRIPSNLKRSWDVLSPS